MPEINFNQAREFLEKINSEDKVAVIHHDDGDGFCSGIIFYDWCKKQGAEVEEFTYVISKTKLREFDLSEFNKFIVTDLASNFMSEELANYDDKEIFYLDHHPKESGFSDNVKYLITTNLGYVPASRTAYELTDIRPLLGLTGTINDAGDLHEENIDFINDKLEEFNISLEEFKDKVSNKVSNTINYFSGEWEKVFGILSEINCVDDLKKLEEYSHEIESEIRRCVEEYDAKKEKIGDVNFYCFDSKFHVRGAVSYIISDKYPDEKFIFASPRENENRISISGRCQSGEVDMAEFLKAGIVGLENANAGGHRRASGAGIDKEDLEKFKENVRKFVNSKD